jgi:exodeoxyribonuclease VII small subunit
MENMDDIKLFGEDAPKKEAKRAHPEKEKQAQPKRAKTPAFEEKYARLERILAEIEREELPLEKLIELFEEGVGLVRECSAYLQEARLVIESHLEEGGGGYAIKDSPAKPEE